MVAVIIPCYNEEKRFKRKEWRDYILSKSNFHFFFVDDGSTDNTLQLLNSTSYELSNVTILKSIENIGKGPIIRFAIGIIDIKLFDYISFIDSDLEIPLFQIDALYEKILSNPKSQMCLTYRNLNNKNVRSIRDLGSKIIRWLSSKIIKVSDPIEDTQCGCKIFSKEAIYVFDEPFISKWLFDIEIILRIRDNFGTMRGRIDYVRLENLNSVPNKAQFNIGVAMKIFRELNKINKIYN